MLPSRWQSSSKERRGTVLLVALFVMIPIAALTYATMRMATSYNRENLGAIVEEQALFIAEAGLQESIVALRAGGTGNVGTEAAPVFFGHGLFWVTCQQVGNSLFLVRSHAMYESGRSAVESLIFRRTDDLLGTSRRKAHIVDQNAGARWTGHRET